MNKTDRVKPLPTVLADAYDHLWSELAAQIRAYKNARTKAKHSANAVRALTFLAFATGFLLPLANQVLEMVEEPISWGYVSFAIGGVILLYDQLFTISSSYARLRATEIQLLDVLQTLELEWAVNRASSPSSDTEAWKLLETASAASRSINRTQVEQWMAERERSLGILAGKIAAQHAPKT